MIKTVSLSYGPKRKVPTFLGDESPSYYVRDINIPYEKIGMTERGVQMRLTCYPFEVANELSKLGFKTSRPCSHPNGSGGVPLTVTWEKGQKLPEKILVDTMIEG